MAVACGQPRINIDCSLFTGEKARGKGGLEIVTSGIGVDVYHFAAEIETL